MLPGQVQGQSPAAGSSVPKGATVTIESTPGNPPPAGPIPDVFHRLLADALSVLQGAGYTVTTTFVGAPPEVLRPDGTPVLTGTVWSVTPAVGTVSIDGKLTLQVQP